MNSSKIKRITSSAPKSNIFPYVVVVLLVLLADSAASAPPLLFPQHHRRIAIDPGHGGSDEGARGPTGVAEKTITLALARKLALKLETDYEVILTRSDDYSLAPLQRSAIANHAKADIFISIHTGAGFLHSTNSLTIYHYSPAVSDASFSTGHVGSDDGQRWDRAQMRHKEAGISLAAALHKNLEKIAGVSDCKILSAPLIVLKGADMPAVLVEVGHITHPATEKSLSAPQGIEMLAHAIEQGVKEYFESPAIFPASEKNDRQP